MPINRSGQRPLKFLRSIPSSGAKNVSLKPIIHLFFDKNVVNDSVWQNNRRQFELFRGTISVPITVTRIKDTVDFNRRNEIFVKPVNSLRTSTTYTLVIKKDLRSKAGEELGKRITITFKTRAERNDE